MYVPDSQLIAQTLSPVRGRKCERRNLVARFRKGRVQGLTQRDMHYIRQARFIQRVGRPTYEALHTIKADNLIQSHDFPNIPANVPSTLFDVAFALQTAFSPGAIQVDEDLRTVSLSLQTGSMLFAWKADDSVVCVLWEGDYTHDELTKLSDADTRLRAGLQRAFLNGVRSGKSDIMAEQIQLAAFGRQAGQGPINA
jgi:hypothetical protein